MIAAALVLSLVAGAVVEAPAPAKLLVLELATVDVSREQAAVVEDALTEALARHPELAVVAATDLKRLVEVESQKQAMGCDESSCLAEIAGAIGARYVVFGRVAHLSSTIVVQLNLFDANQAAAVARESFEAKDVAGARTATPRAVEKLVAPLGVMPVVVDEDAPPPSTGVSPLLVAGAAVGVAGLGLAAVGAGVGAWFTSTLTTASSAPADKQTAIDWWWAPWTTLAVGAVVVVAGGALVGVGLIE